MVTDNPKYTAAFHFDFAPWIEDCSRVLRPVPRFEYVPFSWTHSTAVWEEKKKKKMCWRTGTEGSESFAHPPQHGASMASEPSPWRCRRSRAAPWAAQQLHEQKAVACSFSRTSFCSKILGAPNTGTLWAVSRRVETYSAKWSPSRAWMWIFTIVLPANR